MKNIQYAAGGNRPAGMRHIGRDDHHVAGFELQGFAAEYEFKAAFQQVKHLLVHVRVFGQGGAGVHIHVGQRHVVGVNEPAVVAGDDVEVVDVGDNVLHSDNFRGKIQVNYFLGRFFRINHVGSR